MALSPYADALPGTWTRARTIEGIAGAAGIGLTALSNGVAGYWWVASMRQVARARLPRAA